MIRSPSADKKPYASLLSNIARGYVQLGNNDKAMEYLLRCEKLQPKAAAVRSLKVVLLSRTGKEPEAALLAKQSLEEGIYDTDMVNAAYALGMRKGDYELAIKGLELRIKGWPATQVDAYLKLGGIYAAQKKDDAKALDAFKAALAAAPQTDKDMLRKQIPPAYLARL